MSEYEREDLRQEDEETGITLKIIADTDAESPVAADIANDVLRFAVYHRHRINPSEDQLPNAEDAKAFAEENAADDSEWAVFDLFAYEHGNIMFKAGVMGNPFTCAFDSGQIGIIALKRAEFGGDLLETANGICRTYTDWANGEVYGYVVEGPGVDDSCWGYIGDPEDDGAYTEGKDVFDAAVKERKEAMAGEAMERADLAAAAERAAAESEDAINALISAAQNVVKEAEYAAEESEAVAALREALAGLD